MRTAVLHLSFSENIGVCGALEENELVRSADLLLRRFAAKCESRVYMCDWSRHSMETLLIIADSKQPIVETRAERGCE